MWCHPCKTRRPCTAPIDLRASNSVRSVIYVSQDILAELPKICEPQTLPDRLYACWHSKPLRWARTKISLKYLRPGIPDKGGVQDDRGSRREYFGTLFGVQDDRIHYAEPAAKRHADTAVWRWIAWISKSKWAPLLARWPPSWTLALCIRS